MAALACAQHIFILTSKGLLLDKGGKLPLLSNEIQFVGPWQFSIRDFYIKGGLSHEIFTCSGKKSPVGWALTHDAATPRWRMILVARVRVHRWTRRTGDSLMMGRILLLIIFKRDQMGSGNYTSCIIPRRRRTNLDEGEQIRLSHPHGDL